MDPLEEADNEAEGGNEKRNAEIYGGHCNLTIHSIVQGRKGTTRDQEIDACVVESVGDCVHL